MSQDRQRKDYGIAPQTVVAFHCTHATAYQVSGARKQVGLQSLVKLTIIRAGMKEEGGNPELKLEIEVVPGPSWANNLRKRISKGEWDKIRRKAYADHGHRCGICGIEGRLECHEIWQYDDDRHIQKLAGFIALCPRCHNVKHIGLAAERGLYDEAVEHFMNVNNCSKEEFKNYEKEVFARWRERSQYQWHVDLGEYKKIVEAV